VLIQILLKGIRSIDGVVVVYTWRRGMIVRMGVLQEGRKGKVRTRERAETS
jgi:hypothetical protein